MLFLLAAVGTFGLEKAEMWGCVASVMLVGFGLVAGGRIGLRVLEDFICTYFFPGRLSLDFHNACLSILFLRGDVENFIAG